MFKNKLILFLFSLAILEAIIIIFFFVESEILKKANEDVLGVIIAILGAIFIIGFCMPLILYFLYDFNRIIKSDFKKGLGISLFLLIPPLGFAFYILYNLGC